MRYAKPGLEKRALSKSIGAGGLDPKKQARQERRLAFVNRKMGRKPAPKAGQPGVDPEMNGPPMDIRTTQPIGQVPPPQGQPDTSALFPNQRAFEFKNWEGSPLFQFQRDEGMKAIDRKLAAEGLKGSGFQFDQYRNFLTDLGAREAERNSQVAQREADRLQQMQQSEADRRERVGNNAWDRSFNLLELMSRQNPMGYAFSGTQNLGSAYDDLANKRNSFISNQYPRVSGGGGYVPSPYLPPPASGPDYSGFNVAGIKNGAASNTNWLDSIIDTIGGFSKVPGFQKLFQ